MTTCERCGGDGVLADRSNPDFVRVVPCSCAIDRRVAQLRADLGETYATCHFATFEVDRVYQKPVTWGGFTVDPDRQRLIARHALAAAQAYAERPDGHWLYLCGPNGSGKTHLAAAIAYRLVEQLYSIRWETAPDLLDELRAGYDVRNVDDAMIARLDRLRSVDVLVLDELGAERATEWADEKLYQILNYRAVHALPTVITSNLRREDHPPRIASRIAGMAEEVVLITCDQRRMSRRGAYDHHHQTAPTS